MTLTGRRKGKSTPRRRRLRSRRTRPTATGRSAGGLYANSTLVATSASIRIGDVGDRGAAGAYTLTAVATDNLDVSTTSAPVHVTVNAPAGRTNVALAANGATAIASSTYDGAMRRAAQSTATGRGCRGAVAAAETRDLDAWPDSLEVDFAGAKTIEEVDVFSLQDNFTAPVDRTPALTSALRPDQLHGAVSGWNAVDGGARAAS